MLFLCASVKFGLEICRIIRIKSNATSQNRLIHSSKWGQTCQGGALKWGWIWDGAGGTYNMNYKAKTVQVRRKNSGRKVKIRASM